MLITIPQKRIEYIDNEAFRIVGEMKDLPNPEPSTSELKGSAKEKGVVDWTDKLVDAPVRISSILITGEKADQIECYRGRCYGFDQELYKDFLKLVKTIEKDKAINSHISLEFLLENCFDWFAETYKNQRAKCNLSEYIIEKTRESINEYVFHYPVLYLEIGEHFTLGKTKIGYYTKEVLENLEQKFLSQNPDKKDDNPYEFIKKELLGEVLVSYKVNAEKEKAKQIAFEECSLAIDVLKLCSLTTEFPDYRLSFDIDSRTTENLKNSVIYTEASNPYAFAFNLYRLPNEYKIDQNEWNSMLQKQLADFHNFLLCKDKFDTELKRLIVNSIKMYAAAISKTNLNQRVVELFTILESLLLKDDNVPIIESVCNYCSKLVFQKIEDRKYLISLLKKMYGIRSAMVHHALRKEIEMNDLKRLQLTVVMLVIQLIKRLEKYKTKVSILQEIDDEILKAYSH
jgi:hypothetical protein